MIIVFPEHHPDLSQVKFIGYGSIDYYSWQCASTKQQASVYKIDDVYIGASGDTRLRIIQHVQQSRRRKHHNKGLQCYINARILNNQTIIVTKLSSILIDEGKFILDLKPMFNSTRPGAFYNLHKGRWEWMRENKIKPHAVF